VRKDGRDLERAHQTHARDARGRRAGDLAALEENLPARRLKEVGEQVEARRLAGAVRTDERVDAAAPHLQRDVLNRYETLELLGQPARFENRFVDQPPLARGG
jgi:hypothetical protein